MKHILLAVLFALATVTATAQDQERPDRWYDIEVLVFDQPNAGSDEELPEPPIALDTTGTIELVSSPGNSQLTPYQILPPESYRLRPAFNKLSSSNRYQPVLHIAWRQSVPPRENADRIHLIGNGVDGILTIGISRYLHVTADLLVPMAEDGTSNRFHLQGQLRMRSGEVHYIDHPMGGVLIEITPYTP